MQHDGEINELAAAYPLPLYNSIKNVPDSRLASRIMHTKFAYISDPSIYIHIYCNIHRDVALPSGLVLPICLATRGPSTFQTKLSREFGTIYSHHHLEAKKNMFRILISEMQHTVCSPR